MMPAAPPADRPRPGAPGLAAGIDEALIARLVHTFYERVRRDPEIGPIFERAVDDWPDHLARLCDFWSSVTLLTRRYKGRPVPAHVKHPEIGPGGFARWLALFRETAREVCPPEAAALFIDRAERIGDSLQGAIELVRSNRVSPFGTPTAG